jgi:hypothetical protein
MKKLLNLLIKYFCNKPKSGKLEIAKDLEKDLTQQVLDELKEESNRLDASIYSLLTYDTKIKNKAVSMSEKAFELRVIS